MLSLIYIDILKSNSKRKRAMLYVLALGPDVSNKALGNKSGEHSPKNKLLNIICVQFSCLAQMNSRFSNGKHSNSNETFFY